MGEVKVFLGHAKSMSSRKTQSFELLSRVGQKSEAVKSKVDL